MNAASAQVATSAQDVQLQQQGKPTMAQGGELQGDEERMTQAKMALEDARALDRQGSRGLHGEGRRGQAPDGRRVGAIGGA